MQGKNAMLLNKATLMEALQMWVNDKLADPLTVTDVVAPGDWQSEWKIVLDADKA
jgi:hypothetical protein